MVEGRERELVFWGGLLVGLKTATFLEEANWRVEDMYLVRIKEGHGWKEGLWRVDRGRAVG